jgi:hypothetical protein
VVATAVAFASLALLGVARADDLPPEAVIAAIPFETSQEPNRILVNLAADGSPPFKLMLDAVPRDPRRWPRDPGARRYGLPGSPVALGRGRGSPRSAANRYL